MRAWSISVVLAGYGGDTEGLERSIDSALGQTVGDVEVVIVGAADMVERAGRVSLEGRLVVVRADEGGDRSVDRVRGLQAASGELVAFLEPGDLWFEDHLERAAACFAGGAGVGLVLAPVAYVGSDAATYVREPDFEALQAAGAVPPPGSELSDLLPLWTISGCVAPRAVLLDPCRGDGMLLNRAAEPPVDGLKWSDFGSRWGIRGDARPPGALAFEAALAQCVWMLYTDQTRELEGVHLGAGGPAIDPLAADSVAGFTVEVDHEALASGRVTSSLHLQAASLVRQLWVRCGPASSTMSLLASQVTTLEHRAPDLLPLLDLWLFGDHSRGAVARLLVMPIAEVRRELLRGKAYLRHLTEAG